MPSIDYRQLVPLQKLNATNIDELLSKSHQECLKRKQRISANSERNWFIYLVSGEIDLGGKNQASKRIYAHDLRASRPVFTEACVDTFFTALNDCTFLKVDRKHFENLMQEQSASGIHVDAHATVDGDSHVVQQIFTDYRNGKIQTPSLPELAMRVKDVADDDDATINDLSSLIQTDPAMSGKVIYAANSVAFRGRRDLQSIRDAVIRLGMKSTRNLVIAFSMNELFQAKKPFIRAHLLDNWEHSVLTATYTQVLAEKLKINTPERFFLVGLLHNIGAIAVLAYVEACEGITKGAQVASVLAQMRRFVSVLVLQRWEMPEEFVCIAENAGKFEAMDPSYQVSLDLVSLAKHEAWCDKGRANRLPSIEKIPAFKRMQPGAVNGDGQLQWLADAKEKSLEMLKVFS